MADNEQDSIDLLVEDWWDRWRAEDYSWDGLAEKFWEGWSITPSAALVESAQAPDGSRPATLQDYWRDQEGALITTDDGARWTLAHLPLELGDGVGTGKGDWNVSERLRLGNIIRTKLEAARPTTFRGQSSMYQQVEGADRRAQLQGVVLFDELSLLLPSDRPAYLILEQAAFIEPLDFGLDVKDPATFARALFNAGIDLVGQFESAAIFAGIVCRGEFRARRAFRADASLTGAVISGVCGMSVVNGEFNADNARFDSRADFQVARFGGVASFVRAQFNGEAMFGSARFESTANFGRAIFARGAAFYSAIFSGTAAMNWIKVDSSCDFDRALFLNDLQLSEASLQRLYFREASILGQFTLVNSIICGKCYFNRTSFVRGNRQGSLNFEASCFQKMTDFDGVIFPELTQNFSGAFIGCRFEDWVDFRRTGTHWIAALDEAITQSKILLEDPDEEAAVKDFKKVILVGVANAAHADAEVQTNKLQEELDDFSTRENRLAKREAEMNNQPAPADVKARRVTAAEGEEFRAKAFQERLKQLEGGCRTIKVAMGRERDEMLEQRYYRFQLMARRQQKGVPFWEKFFSGLYAYFSDYGASMTRPFVAAFFTWLGFGVLFWVWSRGIIDHVGPAPVAAWLHGQMRFDPTFFEALRYSASRLLPFGAFGGDPDKWPWLSDFIVGQGPVWAFWIRLAASAESSFALVLVFLFALAVRRRFQIT